MDEQQIRKIAQEVYEKNSSVKKFGVFSLPAHTHNKVDSLPVPYSNIVNKTKNYSFTIPGTSAATASNYSTFFISQEAMTVLSISEVHAVLGTDGGAVTLNIEKLTGTQAPGAGVSLLSTTFNLKSTINTVVNGSLVASQTVKNIASGDRLAFVLSGTPTSVANVTVSITFGF